MTTAELLIDEIRTLSSRRVDEVLAFVHKIKRDEAGAVVCAENHDDSWFENGGECPICAKYRDPLTGESPCNAETVAAIEDGEAILRGEIPAKRYNTVEEFFADLDS